MRFFLLKLYQTQQRQQLKPVSEILNTLLTYLIFYEMHLHTGSGICRPHMGGKNVCNSQSEEKKTT